MPIEAAHVRIGSGAGMGEKPDDFRAVSLCSHHHAEQHRMGEATFWQRIAWQNPENLIEAFISSSPKKREIEEVRKERQQ